MGSRTFQRDQVFRREPAHTHTFPRREPGVQAPGLRQARTEGRRGPPWAGKVSRDGQALSDVRREERRCQCHSKGSRGGELPAASLEAVAL